MPWPIFQIAIRNTLNFYSIKEFVHISFRRGIPKISQKIKIPSIKSCIYSGIDGLFNCFLFLYLFMRLILSSSLVNKKLFLTKIGNLSIQNCKYGDLVISKFLRCQSSKGVLSLSRAIFPTIQTVFLAPFIFTYIKFAIDDIYDNREKIRLILIIPEIVRMSQFIRRVAYQTTRELGIDIFEIIFNESKNQFEIKSFLDPFDFVISSRAIKKFEINKDLIEECWEKLNMRLFTNNHEHAHTANLYKEFDVDANSIIDNNLVNFLSEDIPTLFFPLHQVADSQFEWGFDDFGDIDTFTKSVIDFCVEKKYKLIIKPHPMGFNTINKQKYKIETSFYKSLIRKYFHKNFKSKIDLYNNSFISEEYPNLILISHSYPLNKIKNISKSKLLTVTRHGNIVIESIALEVPCVSCSRSRYYNFNLPNTYKNFVELTNIINTFFDKPSSFEILKKEDIKYLTACAIIQRKKGFDVLSDLIVKSCLPNSDFTTAYTEPMKMIHKKLKISKFKTLESTSEIKESNIKFLEIIKFILEKN